MNKIYVLTGYDKHVNKLSTRMLKNINDVYVTLQYFLKEEFTVKYRSPRDLDFDVQSRRSHNGAVIVENAEYAWSIFRP